MKFPSDILDIQRSREILYNGRIFFFRGEERERRRRRRRGREGKINKKLLEIKKACRM
jgi:hypothetical protein